MKNVPYDPKYNQDFIEMNQAWIVECFTIEDEDIKEQSNIETAIDKGGQIFLGLMTKSM